jgi:hypothetical protein
MGFSIRAHFYKSIPWGRALLGGVGRQQLLAHGLQTGFLMNQQLCSGLN